MLGHREDEHALLRLEAFKEVVQLFGHSVAVATEEGSNNLDAIKLAHSEPCGDGRRPSGMTNTTKRVEAVKCSFYIISLGIAYGC